MNYLVLAREIQKLGYGCPERPNDSECAKEYVESIIQQMERRSISRFEALVEEHDVSAD
ncbi:hypothetical protein KY333_02795 [Candidatus Woesearchaeota archaeon]|nr:hypothetical protein [Candidatus Woesearchaeota archaeon]